MTLVMIFSVNSDDQFLAPFEGRVITIAAASGDVIDLHIYSPCYTSHTTLAKRYSPSFVPCYFATVLSHFILQL
jgi:hypothetical protein